MRANIIHITDHAIIRWKQRVDCNNFTEQYIRESISKAKFLKKNDLLPYTTPRIKNTIYAIFGKILFVLQPIGIKEFNLITVITKSHNYIHPIKIHKKRNKNKTRKNNEVEKTDKIKKKSKRTNWKKNEDYSM